MAEAQDGVIAEIRAAPREDRVRAAALRLFKEKGYHATSMRDIASEVGINKGSLYSYIRSKEDLLIPVFERAMGVLLAQIEAIAADASLQPTPPTVRRARSVCLHNPLQCSPSRRSAAASLSPRLRPTPAAWALSSQ